MLIGVSGKIGSGKDTVTEMIRDYFRIEYNRNIENRKFAKKLKDFAAEITGIPREWFDDPEKKNKVLGPEWNINESLLDNKEIVDKPMTLRELMIRIGHGCRIQVHPDIWVNALFSDYKDQIPHRNKEGNAEYPDWIISDLRYPNELKRIELLQGYTIRIERDDIQKINHDSETLLDNANFDYFIENNSSLEDLRNQVNLTVKKILATV